MSASTAATLKLMVRREFWEHRAFVIAPIIVAGIMVITAIFGTNDLYAGGAVPDPDWLAHSDLIVAGVLAALALPYGVVMGIVLTFYLLDSLYADRKDRSVLFWKSLPISDTATVGSKLLTAAVIVPLLTFGAVIVTNIVMAFIFSLRLSGIENFDVWRTVWQPGIWLHAHVLLLYGLMISILWYLPIFAWFMLTSAWARRAVILWAALPPLFAMMLEKYLFGTWYVAQLLGDRLTGWTQFSNKGFSGRAIEVDGERVNVPQRISDFIDFSAFVTSPGLWAGLIVAALLLWATVLLRRRSNAI